jgi:adenine-specific DNA-methyltransferase
MNHIKKFQGLLEELFQFDAADLDFGVYRIMNYKRGVIERFIQEDLPRSIFCFRSRKETTIIYKFFLCL